MNVPVPLSNRFWDKVVKTGTCWVWAAATYNGYGRVDKSRPTKGNALAHKVAWELVKGYPVPLGFRIRRTCNNRLCVNVSHMYLEKYKLNKEKVREIQELWNSGKYMQKDLAKMYGVGTTTIHDAIWGRTWSGE